MNMVIPDEGKTLWLDRSLNGAAHAGEDWGVVLYDNNYTPVDTSTASNFSAASFTGAGPFTVHEANWGASVIVAHVAQSTNSDVPTWTNTGATTDTIYGWVAVGASSGKVLAAQRFDSPRVMSPGSTETLTPFTISSKTFA